MPVFTEAPGLLPGQHLAGENNCHTSQRFYHCCQGNATKNFCGQYIKDCESWLSGGIEGADSAQSMRGFVVGLWVKLMQLGFTKKNAASAKTASLDLFDWLVVKT